MNDARHDMATIGKTDFDESAWNCYYFGAIVEATDVLAYPGESLMSKHERDFQLCSEDEIPRSFTSTVRLIDLEQFRP
ncbi:hypothetical protein QVA66_10845 [Staphylococcus chromogenes]|nr:hypothetical protein [Staphylococcus chromogenes]